MKEKLKKILEEHASHMNNLICLAHVCKKGHDDYKDIPEHVVKSLSDLENMWIELHELYQLHKAVEK